MKNKMEIRITIEIDGKQYTHAHKAAGDLASTDVRKAAAEEAMKHLIKNMYDQDAFRDQQMSDSYINCMDSETGGLDPKKTDLLTLYMAMMTEDFQVVEELDLKLKPNDGRLPIAEAQALQVNKIDLTAHLSNPATITYAEARLKIIEFTKKYLKKRGRYSNLIVLGQNVQFDLNFIWQYVIPKEEWEGLYSYNVEDTKTAGLFLKRCGWIPQDVGTLGSFVQFFNIAKREAHEAKGDVWMTIDVYKAMIAMMESKKNAGASQDLISLLEAE